MLVATQHGDHHEEVAYLVVAVLHILRLQFEGHLLFLMTLGVLMLTDQSVEGVFQVYEVVLTIAL